MKGRTELSPHITISGEQDVLFVCKDNNSKTVCDKNITALLKNAFQGIPMRPTFYYTESQCLSSGSVYIPAL